MSLKMKSVFNNCSPLYSTALLPSRHPWKWMYIIPNSCWGSSKTGLRHPKQVLLPLRTCTDIQVLKEKEPRHTLVLRIAWRCIGLVPDVSPLPLTHPWISKARIKVQKSRPWWWNPFNSEFTTVLCRCAQSQNFHPSVFVETLRTLFELAFKSQDLVDLGDILYFFVIYISIGLRFPPLQLLLPFPKIQRSVGVNMKWMNK